MLIILSFSILTGCGRKNTPSSTSSGYEVMRPYGVENEDKTSLGKIDSIKTKNSDKESVSTSTENVTKKRSNYPEIDQILFRLMELPQVKMIEKPAFRIMSKPTKNKPYYEIEAGSNKENQFLTEYWFHAYSMDDIRFWDVVKQQETSLMGKAIDE